MTLAPSPPASKADALRTLLVRCRNCAIPHALRYDIDQVLDASPQAPTAGLRSAERHALYVALEHAKLNPGLDPTAVKLLRELYERSADTAAEPAIGTKLSFEEGRDNHLRDQGEMKEQGVLGSLVDEDGWVLGRIWSDHPMARELVDHIVNAVNGTSAPLSRFDLRELRDEMLTEAAKTASCYTCYTDLAALVARRLTDILESTELPEQPTPAAPELRLLDFNLRAREGEPLHVDASFKGEPVKAFAVSFIEWFRREGGTNFVTVDLRDPLTGEAYSITMQKAGGKTPAQELGELRAALNKEAAT